MANKNPKLHSDIKIGQKITLQNIRGTKIKKFSVLHLRENTMALLIRRWKSS